MTNRRTNQASKMTNRRTNHATRPLTRLHSSIQQISEVLPSLIYLSSLGYTYFIITARSRAMSREKTSSSIAFSERPVASKCLLRFSTRPILRLGIADVSRLCEIHLSREVGRSLGKLDIRSPDLSTEATMVERTIEEQPIFRSFLVLCKTAGIRLNGGNA